VYYPGSGTDGGPVAAFNKSGAAHCFVYVDYQMTRMALESELKAGFRGYESVLRAELKETDLVTDWVRHATTDYRCPPFFGFIEVLQRKPGLDSTHGAERFAVLFLAADGYAAFDALFCQDNGVPPPFCIVAQDHGFGGGYSSFGHGGLLEQLAEDAHVKPYMLLVGDNTREWKDYRRCDAEAEKMGEPPHDRYLYAWCGATTA
jgi:hypothetical protein